VPDSCIRRLRPLTLNQATVSHSVPWYGVICRCSQLVVIRDCHVSRQYPSLFALTCFTLLRGYSLRSEDV